MTKIRWLFIISIILIALVIAGFRLTQPEPETVVAAPVPPPAVKTESLSVQALTSEEVEIRSVAVVNEQKAIFKDATLGYHLSYPLHWEKETLSSTTVLFQSPDGTSQVRVEAVGPLPADGLAPFVDRSLGDEIIYSRQLLTVHGLPAERVVAYSEPLGQQVTTFYIELDGNIFLVTGTGYQKSIEMIARSFNAPQVIAQR
jgi:hypothetical protein